MSKTKAKKPPHVEAAIWCGDKDFLSRCGKRSAERKKERKKELERLRHAAVCQYVANPENYLEECWQRDQAAHIDTHPVDD